jgi:hypothetical protein
MRVRNLIPLQKLMALALDRSLDLAAGAVARRPMDPEFVDFVAFLAEQKLNPNQIMRFQRGRSLLFENVARSAGSASGAGALQAIEVFGEQGGNPCEDVGEALARTFHDVRFVCFKCLDTFSQFLLEPTEPGRAPGQKAFEAIAQLRTFKREQVAALIENARDDRLPLTPTRFEIFSELRQQGAGTA